jgi:hypothetical protein
MMLVVPVALAHGGALPHIHAVDPRAVGVIVMWIVLALMWLGVAARGAGRIGVDL